MPEPIFHHRLEVPAAAIDANGHANNVEFVRWMQDAAVAHADAAGCTAATTAAGATWVATSHHIEYRRPALLGDRVTVQTWVAYLRRTFSLRKYKFIRDGDGMSLATGETNWAFVDAQSGRPKSIPPDIAAMFQLVGADQEP
jgi:acyl-CoA thioester hydrolase